MQQIQATVGILTYNSGATLARALESVKDFAEIIVCDGGSTDATLDIARAFGARIIPQDSRYKNADNTLNNYSGVRNQCLDAAMHEWFFYIDSDETASPGLLEEVRTAAGQTGGPLVYRVPIGIMMDGRYIKHSSNYPGYQTRFFNKRSGARFVRTVHEKIEFSAAVPVGTLRHPWYVHTTRAEWSTYLRDNARYRRLEARRGAEEPWGVFVRGVLWQLRTASTVACKVAWLRVRYGGRDSVPLGGEIGRVLTPLYLVGEALRLRFSRQTNGSRYSLK